MPDKLLGENLVAVTLEHKKITKAEEFFRKRLRWKINPLQFEGGRYRSSSETRLLYQGGHCGYW
jgi:hypothetical protein